MQNVANIHKRLINGKATIEVNAVKKWICRVNGNPSEKRQTDFSATVNEDNSKPADGSLKRSSVSHNL